MLIDVQAGQVTVVRSLVSTQVEIVRRPMFGVGDRSFG